MRELFNISSSHYELQNRYMIDPPPSCPPLLSPPKQKKIFFGNAVLRFMNGTLKTTNQR